VDIPFVVTGRLLGAILFILIFGSILYFIRRGKIAYVRKPASLSVIDEGIGRATEMGKPAVFLYGLSRGMFEQYTVAAFSILSYIARICAETDTQLIVPSGGDEASYITRPVAVEIVRNAYREAGKPELFNEELVPFYSGLQFAYGMSVVGLLLSKKPGFFMMSGNYGADIMMMAETGMNVGSFTITTTTDVSYTACMAGVSDYMMLGEETPAAGAYLSKDPSQLASLSTGDYFKIAAIIVIALGSILLTLGDKTIVTLLGV